MLSAMPPLSSHHSLWCPNDGTLMRLDGPLDAMVVGCDHCEFVDGVFPAHDPLAEGLESGPN